MNKPQEEKQELNQKKYSIKPENTLKLGESSVYLNSLEKLDKIIQRKILTIFESIVARKQAQEVEVLKHKHYYQLISLYATIVGFGITLISCVILLFLGKPLESSIAFIFFVVIIVGVNVFYRRNITLKLKDKDRNFEYSDQHPVDNS